jgi:hypothetical protein
MFPLRLPQTGVLLGAMSAAPEAVCKGMFGNKVINRMANTDKLNIFRDIINSYQFSDQWLSGMI